MVLVSTKDRLKIYTHLLQEGVFCFKKQYYENNKILDIPNLNCFLVLRSLASRQYCTEIFSWQWHYYFLTQTGITYLREYLGLPDNVIPNSHKFNNPIGEEDQEQDEENKQGGERRGNRGRGRGGNRGGNRGRGRGRGSGKTGEEGGNEEPAPDTTPAES